MIDHTNPIIENAKWIWIANAEFRFAPTSSHAPDKNAMKDTKIP